MVPIALLIPVESQQRLLKSDLCWSVLDFEDGEGLVCDEVDFAGDLDGVSWMVRYFCLR